MANVSNFRLTASFGKVILSAAAASAAFVPFAGPAVAQGAPPTWTGVYVGGQLGWVGSRSVTSVFVSGYSSGFGQARNRLNGPAIGIY